MTCINKQTPQTPSIQQQLYNDDDVYVSDFAYIHKKNLFNSICKSKTVVCLCPAYSTVLFYYSTGCLLTEYELNGLVCHSMNNAMFLYVLSLVYSKSDTYPFLNQFTLNLAELD